MTEQLPPHPNAENMQKYWIYRKQDAIHSLEVAIRNLDYFDNQVKVNNQAKEQYETTLPNQLPQVD